MTEFSCFLCFYCYMIGGAIVHLLNEYWSLDQNTVKKNQKQVTACKQMHISSAVKRLIAINHIQNKTFCLHNICMCTVFIYYVFINTHKHTVYSLKIFMCIYIYKFIFLYYIYLMYKHNIFFLNIYMHVFVFLYTVAGGANDRHSGRGVRPRRGFYSTEIIK